MRTLILTVAAVTLLLVARPSSTSLQIGEAATNPLHPDACWFEDKKLAIKAGQEHVPPGRCESIRCSQNSDGTLHFTVEQCGAVAPPPGCRIERDPTLGYPACCTNIVCDKQP
ncbi:Single domain Von Willebrand factor type C domain [Trinorchestia longiramus]|nr:Single domain Von Willebrand factor type C domain [Trinorchestia longiramus]